MELRRGRAREGDNAVFQCGRNILRGKIVKREEGSLSDVLRQDNYKNIIPSALALDDAINYIRKLYGTTEGVFTTFTFKSPNLLRMFHMKHMFLMEQKEFHC